MWFSFAVVLIICIALVYFPGFFQLRAFGLKGPAQIALSPIISVSELAALGVVFTFVDLPGSFPILFSLTAMTIMVVLAGKFFFGRCCASCSAFSWRHLLLYLILGALIGAWYFVWNLDGPGSFVQEFDNAYHLNLITKYIESGFFSSLHASILGDEISYYPSAFHVVAALAGSLVGVSSSIAENASIFVFAFCVFPGSIYLFLAVLFKGKQLPVLLGSLLALSFSAFPWGFLVAGPLYPNMAAFSCLPGLMSAFMLAFEDGGKRNKAIYSFVVIVGFVFEFFAQPNAIFTAIVILAPFVALRIYQAFPNKKYGLLVSAAFVVSVFAFLLICYKLPFLNSVTHYKCVPYTETVYQATIDFADFGYRNTVAQPILSFLVLMGILAVLSKGRMRWILFPLLFFFIGYVYAGCKGPSFLTGFWYNDVDRVAANAVLLLIPLATAGLTVLLKASVSFFEQGIGSMSKKWCNVVIVSAVMLGIFCPSHIDAGNGYVNTAFGDRASRMDELAKSAVSLTGEEKGFLLECRDIVNEDVVLNNPYDGSVFAYSVCGLRTEYTQFFSKGDEAHQAVQHGLDMYAKDLSTREALESMGIKYYLSLDRESDPDSTFYNAFFKESEWNGMLAVNDSTPGFEVVLSCGDMRLYKLSQL